jgi:MFS family permease
VPTEPGAESGPGGDERSTVTFADVFRLPEYRALWTAQLLSLVGDQLAIVALTWLVFERSGSPLFAAVAYAISFLPWLIGGPFLSGIADRLPRREVMVVCDIGRGVLMVPMAVAGLPLWALCALLFTSELMAPPFAAARAAVLPDVLEGERYIVGTAIGNITNQLGQVLGFAAAGLVVTALTPSLVLGLNAVTFAVSAALIGLGLRKRPAARETDGERASFRSDAGVGLRLVFGRRELRTLTGMALLCLFYVVPEGLAAPFATELGGGAAATGLLLASIPAGSVVGAALLSRWLPSPVRRRWMGPIAVGSVAPLVLCALAPGLGPTVVLFFVVGLATSYQLVANAEFVIAVPPQFRGQAFGLVQALMNVGQGSAIVLAGALAEVWAPHVIVAVAGAAGAVLAVMCAQAWAHTLRAGALAGPGVDGSGTVQGAA